MHNFNKYLLAPLAGGFLLVASVAAVSAQATSGPVTVKISPQSGTSEAGTATLTDNGDGTTTVKLSVTGEPAGADQPTHIHTGHCGQSDFDPKPKYPLTNTKAGSSTTTVKVPLKDLLASPFGINLHKSNTDIATYVACGNITLAQQTGVVAGAPKTGGGGGSSSSGMPIAAWFAAAGAVLLGGVALRRRFNS